MQLVSVPICLRAWGPERYGAWLALFASFMLLRTIDSGYGNYVATQVNVLYHVNRNDMRRSLAAALPLCLALNVVQLLVCGVLVVTGRSAWLLGASAADVARFELNTALLALILAWMLSGSYMSVVHRLLIPIGMMYQAQWWGIAFNIATTGAVVVAALLGASILQAALILAAMQGAVYLASGVYIRAKAPEYFPWWRSPDLKLGGQDFARSTLLTAAGVGQQSITNGIVVFVSSMFGAANVPTFTTIRTLANLWLMLGNVFGAPMLPEVVRFHGTRDHDKLIKAFRAHWFFGGVLVNGSMIALLPLLELIYRRWTHGDLRFERGLLSCAMASVSLTNFALVLNVYLAGINDLRAQLLTMIARAVLTFGVSFALIPWFSLTGIGIAMMVAELTCSVVLAVYFTNRKLADLGARLSSREVLAALLMPLPMHILALQTIVIHRIDNASCAVAMLVLLVLTWRGWRSLDSEIKVRALSVLRRRFR